MFYVPKFNCEISNISGQKIKEYSWKLILLKKFLMRQSANGVKKTEAKPALPRRRMFSFQASSLKTFVN
jgi:hypothetical protein